MDWNNDGKKDLLLGAPDGAIHIYLNTHIDENPVFKGADYLLQGGAKFQSIGSATPHIVDWNNDGKKDVVCGEGTGKIWLLINTGTDADPVFDTKAYIKNGSFGLDLIVIGWSSRPTVLDWDGDGRKDLLSGSGNGLIYCYLNKGTDADPFFDGFIALKAGADYLDVGDWSHPDMADWDGDNVMDLLCGESEGKVAYFHALGPLSLSDNRIHESSGGQITLILNAGPTHAGRDYLILGSVTGTAPGTPLPGGAAVLPLNWDLFTNSVVGLLNTPAFHDFLGPLDGNGTATAVFDTLAPIPGAAGLVVSFAYALSSPWNYASNGANIEIVP